jgi:hypothetical protein
MDLRLRSVVVPAYQIALILIILSTAHFAVVTSDAFSFFRQKGYVPENVVIDIQDYNIGTIATICAALICIAAIPRLPRLAVIAIVPFLAFVGISAAWSSVPEETLKALLKVAGYAIAVCYLVVELPSNKLRTCLLTSAIIGAVASLYVVQVDPTFKDTLGVPGWRGMFDTKNYLGAFCMYMFILISPFHMITAERGTILPRVVNVCLLALSVMSQSKTATAVMVLYYVFCRLLLAADSRRVTTSRRKTILWIALVMWILTFSAVMTAVGFGIQSGDLTFTGRVRVWSFFWQYFLNSPAFGLGGYAVGLDDTISTLGKRAFNMPTPDSSYVILLANQGLAGAILYLGALGVLFNRYYQSASRFSYLGFCGLLAFVAHGVLESGSQFNLSIGLIAVLIQATFAQKVIEVDQEPDDLPVAPPRRGVPLR